MSTESHARKFTHSYICALKAGASICDISDPAIPGQVLRVAINGSKAWLFRFKWDGTPSDFETRLTATPKDRVPRPDPGDRSSVLFIAHEYIEKWFKAQGKNSKEACRMLRADVLPNWHRASGSSPCIERDGSVSEIVRSARSLATHGNPERKRVPALRIVPRVRSGRHCWSSPTLSPGLSVLFAPPLGRTNAYSACTAPPSSGPEGPAVSISQTKLTTPVFDGGAEAGADCGHPRLKSYDVEDDTVHVGYTRR